MAGSTHHVGRLRWQATAPDPAQALALRRLLRERSDDLPAALQAVFDAAVPADEVWRLPTLRLRVRADDLAALAADFDATIGHALRAALAALPRPPRAPAVDDPAAAASTPQRLSLDRSAAVDLWHYLDTGLAPEAWGEVGADAVARWLQDAAVREVEAASTDPSRLAALQARVPLPRRLGVLLRWLALLPPAVRRRWVDIHRPAPPWPAPAADARADDTGIEAQALWLAWPDQDAPPPRPGDREAVRHWLQRPRSIPPALLRALRDAWGDALASSSTVPPNDRGPEARRPVEPPSAPVPIPAPSPDQAIGVPLAGLVLLHPFLPRLLGGCGLLGADGRQLPDASLPRACALLHALACGDRPAPEHQLPLIKLLLGRSPTQPLDDPLPPLRPSDREEVDALLAAVRGHWPALRGSEVQALRLSFLQRRGLLDRPPGGWRLRVQPEAFDLLLGLLPWSIGLVRLPWMPEPLGVEWPTP